MELKNKQINNRKICKLKRKLSKSDYKILKHIEGQITDEEYLIIKTERQQLRDEINRLEEEMI